jgi:MtfA peptidase
MMLTLFLLGLGVMVLIVVLGLRTRKEKKTPMPAGYKQLLEKHVGFYRALDPSAKLRFESRVRALLASIRIHGVRNDIEDLDLILVGASGVIPVFGLPDWRYNNLSDVLLYAEAFDQQHFASSEENRHDVLGMVGSGAMERVMILSKPSLREGYAHIASPGNTGVHEFVHLVDKSDGATDGIPETLLGPHVEPWVHAMGENLHAIRSGHSDINRYGGKNEAEFFAVVSEYFFKRPDLFKERHPDLYTLLSHIYQQEPGLDPQVHHLELQP